MAEKCTGYPIKTARGSQTLRTCVDVTRSNSEPRITDSKGNTIYNWNPSQRKWVPIGGYSERIISPDFTESETYGSILTQNGDAFTKNTIKIINDNLKGSPKTATAYRNGRSFDPWNRWLASNEKNNKPKPDEQGGSTNSETSSGDETAQTIPPGKPFGELIISETENKARFSKANHGLRYPENLQLSQDRIRITALAALNRKFPAEAKPSTTPAPGAQAAPPQAAAQGKPTSATSKPAPAPSQKPTPGKPEENADSTATTEPPLNLDFSFGALNYQKIDEPVLIAVQAPISDQNGVEWGPDQVNAINSALYDLAIKATTSDIQGAVSTAANTLITTVHTEQDRIRRLIAGQAAEISNILARTDNVVLNPNLELLFSGPSLRSFNLTFKMSARSKSEAETIRRIINYFKYHMAVRNDDKGTKNLFLRAPHAFEIVYEYNNGFHPGLNKIKSPCALLNFSVDYTPLGSYATYTDGSMVAYILNLQFQEMVPVYSGDYLGLGDDKTNYSITNAAAPIGY